MVVRPGSTYVDERKIWKVAAHMAAALYTMHSRPEGAALHSDIKPENIFVCADGTCKLGDFGLSTTLSQDAPYAKGAAGTPYYMAPVCLSLFFSIFSLSEESVFLLT